MLKRIVKVAIFLTCYPLVVPAVVCVIILAIYSALRYVAIGEQNTDIIFTPMEWTFDLPFNIIDKIYPN